MATKARRYAHKNRCKVEHVVGNTLRRCSVIGIDEQGSHAESHRYLEHTWPNTEPHNLTARRLAVIKALREFVGYQSFGEIGYDIGGPVAKKLGLDPARVLGSGVVKCRCGVGVALDALGYVTPKWGLLYDDPFMIRLGDSDRHFDVNVEGLSLGMAYTNGIPMLLWERLLETDGESATGWADAPIRLNDEENYTLTQLADHYEQKWGLA